MIVTTAGRPDELSMALALQACQALGATFQPRQKRSVQKIAELFDANVLVAGKKRYEYYVKGAEAPFFFHPNSAAFRLKRLARGEADPLIEAARLQAGDSLLDCTLGIGADAIVAQFQVGTSGKVVGVEVNPFIAFVVKTGMATYDTTELPLTACMRRIEVVCEESLHYLKSLPDRCFDVVYMDPMFEEVIEESSNFEALRGAGSHLQLTAEWVDEAKRVAKKRVVLKAHFRSSLFEQFGFKRDVRLTSKFHFGVIDVN